MNDDIPMDRLATLLARLVKHHGLPLLDETGVEVFAAASGVNLLFFPEDPERVPESWDVAAILPELLKACPNLAGSVWFHPPTAAYCASAMVSNVGLPWSSYAMAAISGPSRG
ncbi:Hydrogenase-1 expression protein HyaE [Methylomagnum ishizawai]|uniref:Hydrogenase-1 expression protein HyaE n=1 Tax=Methylomagnum ishizawai TaxID=1760988 RepID=A0A1Y6DDD0_9GAMM|nr:hypothetical protein [Methylomagnum ishizawai]SMF97515.1 Hydrogenase-1 expression protein HyaE [Methylomagnum ishizawai]